MGVRDGLGRMALAAPILRHQILQKYGRYIIFTSSKFAERGKGIGHQTREGTGQAERGEQNSLKNWEKK